MYFQFDILIRKEQSLGIYVLINRIIGSVKSSLTYRQISFSWDYKMKPYCYSMFHRFEKIKIVYLKKNKN